MTEIEDDPQVHVRRTGWEPQINHVVPVTAEGDQSVPEYPARVDKHTSQKLGAVVYFSSASNNTARFIAHCDLAAVGIDVFRVPLSPKDGPLNVREPYLLVVPTYGGGQVGKAVPPQVKKFLNDPENRKGIRGVIASGNTNFGEAFCMAGDIISRKCHVPFMYYFELMGTKEDEDKVRAGVVEYFTSHPE